MRRGSVVLLPCMRLSASDSIAGRWAVGGADRTRCMRGTSSNAVAWRPVCFQATRGNAAPLFFVVWFLLTDQPGAKRHPGQHPTVPVPGSLREPLVGSIRMETDGPFFAVKA